MLFDTTGKNASTTRICREGDSRDWPPAIVDRNGETVGDTKLSGLLEKLPLQIGSHNHR